MKKRLLLFAGIPLFLLLIVIFGCHFLVIANASGSTFDNVKDIPHNRVGLLLATSPITAAGDHNFNFDYRINATTELFHAGKIDFIIASGGDYSGSQTHGCDEPAAIRDSLAIRGIPLDRIILDYEGTRTLNSIVKAKKAYQLDSLTIISQKYHNQRAIYIANNYGIYAVGYNAKPSPFKVQRFKNSFREYFSRVKMFIDIISGKDFNPTSSYLNISN